MNDLTEFLFCPMHGIFRPQIWPFVGVCLSGVVFYWKRIWSFFK